MKWCHNILILAISLISSVTSVYNYYGYFPNQAYWYGYPSFQRQMQAFNPMSHFSRPPQFRYTSLSGIKWPKYSKWPAYKPQVSYAKPMQSVIRPQLQVGYLPTSSAQAVSTFNHIVKQNAVYMNPIPTATQQTQYPKKYTPAQPYKFSPSQSFNYVPSTASMKPIVVAPQSPFSTQNLLALQNTKYAFSVQPPVIGSQQYSKPTLQQPTVNSLAIQPSKYNFQTKTILTTQSPKTILTLQTPNSLLQGSQKNPFAQNIKGSPTSSPNTAQKQNAASYYTTSKPQALNYSYQLTTPKPKTYYSEQIPINNEHSSYENQNTKVTPPKTILTPVQILEDEGPIYTIPAPNLNTWDNNQPQTNPIYQYYQNYAYQIPFEAKPTYEVTEPPSEKTTKNQYKYFPQAITENTQKTAQSQYTANAQSDTSYSNQQNSQVPKYYNYETVPTPPQTIHNQAIDTQKPTIQHQPQTQQQYYRPGIVTNVPLQPFNAIIQPVYKTVSNSEDKYVYKPGTVYLEPVQGPYGNQQSTQDQYTNQQPAQNQHKSQQPAKNSYENQQPVKSQYESQYPVQSLYSNQQAIKSQYNSQSLKSPYAIQQSVKGPYSILQTVKSQYSAPYSNEQNIYSTPQSVKTQYSSQQPENSLYSNQQSVKNQYVTQQPDISAYSNQQATKNQYASQQSEHSPYSNQQSDQNQYTNQQFQHSVYVNQQPEQVHLAIQGPEEQSQYTSQRPAQNQYTSQQSDQSQYASHASVLQHPVYRYINNNKDQLSDTEFVPIVHQHDSSNVHYSFVRSTEEGNENSKDTENTALKADSDVSESKDKKVIVSTALPQVETNAVVAKPKTSFNYNHLKVPENEISTYFAPMTKKEVEETLETIKAASSMIKTRQNEILDNSSKSTYGANYQQYLPQNSQTYEDIYQFIQHSNNGFIPISGPVVQAELTTKEPMRIYIPDEDVDGHSSLDNNDSTLTSTSENEQSELDNHENVETSKPTDDSQVSTNKTTSTEVANSTEPPLHSETTTEADDIFVFLQTNNTDPSLDILTKNWRTSIVIKKENELSSFADGESGEFGERLRPKRIDS